MSITTTSSTGSTSSASSTSSTGANSVAQTKEQFLQLLITQLKNQDPLSPADSNEFTNQMMQMGQLEQLLTLNQNMSSLASSQQGSMIAQYAGLVGHEAIADGNIFEVVSGTVNPIQFSLPGTPKEVTVNVFDSNGNLVREMSPAISTSGTHTLAFDGKDNNGSDLSEGYYTFTVDASDAAGDTIQATPSSIGRISSVRLSNGTPIFQMGGNDMELSSIQKIY